MSTVQEVDQQAIEEALGIELGKEDEDEDEDEEQEGSPLLQVGVQCDCWPPHETLDYSSATADEQSDDEEPATTSADDEASKKATAEQQKQLSKKV